MKSLQEKEAAQVQTQAAPKTNNPYSTRFGEALESVMEDLIDHILHQSWQIPADEPMTRSESEGIAARLIQERCYYLGETRSEEFIARAWREVRGGSDA